MGISNKRESLTGETMQNNTNGASTKSALTHRGVHSMTPMLNWSISTSCLTTTLNRTQAENTGKRLIQPPLPIFKISGWNVQTPLRSGYFLRALQGI